MTKKDLFFLGAAMALLLIVQAPNLTVPAFWDETMPYVLPALQWINRQSLWNVLPGRYQSAYFLGHPPGFPFLIALVARLTGESLVALRLMMLAFSLASLGLTYRLAQTWGGRSAGAVAMFALLFSQGFVAHATQILPDVALVFGVLAAIYLAAFPSPGWLFCLTLCASALTKETALAAVLPCCLFRAWRLGRGVPLREELLTLVPVGVLPFFFLSEKLRGGTFTSFPFTNDIVHSGKEYLFLLFTYSWRSISELLGGSTFVSVLGGAGVLIYRRHFRAIRPQLVLLAAIPAFFVAGTAFFNSVNMRYILPALAPLLILGAIGMQRLFRYSASQLILVALIVVGNRESYFEILPGKIIGYAPDHSLAYAEMARENQKIFASITEQFPGRKILTEWPYFGMLQEPALGYVKQPVPVTANPADSFDLVLITTDFSPAAYWTFKKLVETNHYPLVLERSRPGGMMLSLYRREKGTR